VNNKEMSRMRTENIWEEGEEYKKEKKGRRRK
jgi:hypothetical protein